MCGYLVEEFLQRWFAMGKVAAEPVKSFGALHLAAEAVDLFVRSRIRDNQYEIHVRDSFDPVADGCTAKQNHTDQRCPPLAHVWTIVSTYA